MYEKLITMDKGTLIKVVAIIDDRVSRYKMYADMNDPFYKGSATALESISEYLQMAIDADVAAMESNTGE